MNIVLITYEFPPVTATGGIGSYMYHLAVFLSGKGHKVTVFSANPVEKAIRITKNEYCVNYLVPAQCNNTFRDAVLPVFEQFMETNQVHVIESPEVGACALRIKERFPSISLIVKIHTPGVLITKISNVYVPFTKKIRFVGGALIRGRIDLGHWARRDKNRDNDLEYQICIKADLLLSPSLALKRWTVKFWGISSSTIKVVPNPFSIYEDLFSLPLKNRPAVISFIGKLSVLKGMIAFSKALPVILEKNRGLKVFLVGRDETENGRSIKKYMEEQLTKYIPHIVFTGAMEKNALKEIYAQSKVCVFPSLWENYPTVVLEAMAAGAAVAASNVGGIPELISNNETGLLFNAMRPQQIAKAVNNLLENEERRLSMVKAARNELQKRINDPRFEDELLKVYTRFENCLQKTT